MMGHNLEDTPDFFRTIVKTMTSMVLSVIRSGNNIIGYRKLIMANDRGRKFQSL